jgi:hypothetical protein
VQVRLYFVDLVSAPVESDPLVPLLPDQPPDAVQAVALVVDQVKVDWPSVDTVVVLALNVNFGAATEAAAAASCASAP